ncbi:hypothetical protein QE417_004029 [Mucilaginibacter terrae]|uniref:Uncharacterized protein n=1 Tax=Mucilaginibacter terrae TaxID=1955052 RepID=A0ABU3GYV3_9SPHI|nr:hypothetical protein [Mucilaginibacter terrae]
MLIKKSIFVSIKNYHIYGHEKYFTYTIINSDRF